MSGPVLPLPIASLLRRVRNAKSPKERHDSAYFAWEASVRLAVSARPPAEPSVLAMPSTGHWIAAGAWGEAPLQDAELIEVRALFSEVVTGSASRPRGVTARTVLEHLAGYRNAVIGHGATRELPFYERACAVLEHGLVRAWERGVFWAPDTRLVFVESVEVDGSGQRRARLMDASGLGTTLMASDAVVSAQTLPGRLYAKTGETLAPLHPWLVLQDSELREAVLFFNGQKKTAHYLDYVSGEAVKARELTRYPSLDADVAAALQRPARSEDGPEDSTQDAFGDYRVLGKLGEGGMGVVYLARQESLGRLVALKMLPAAMSEDAVAVARFRREIAALARCDHPNVVKVLASGQLGSSHYYAMELIEGADLSEVSRALSTTPDLDTAVSSASERVRSAKPEVFAGVARVATVAPRLYSKDGGDSVRKLARMFRDAARSVQALHDVGIIHRDIKPANLMVTAADHRVVIMDLGLALLGDASRSLTRDKSSLLGTLRYMPPEQLQRNLLEVDGRADLYALGATFYELLAGRPIFDGDSEARLIEQVLREEIVSARKVRPSLPADLALILGKCLQKDPKLRYASAEALAQDLDAFLEGRAIAARAPTVGYLLRVAVRRNKALSAALAALVLLSIGGLVLVQLRERRHRAELRESYARSLVDQGRGRLENGTPLQALPFLAEAYSVFPEDPITRQLVGMATQALDAERAVLRVPGVQQAVPLLDGDAAATLDEQGTLTFWKVAADGPQALTDPEALAAAGSWIAASPTSDRVAVARQDGVIAIHDARSGKALRQWRAHEAGVRAVAWATEANRLVSVGLTDRLARAWNPDTGAQEGEAALGEFAVSGWTQDLSGRAAPISGDGLRLAVVRERDVGIADLAAHTVATRFSAPEPAVGAVLSADGQVLIGVGDRKVWLEAGSAVNPELDAIAFAQLSASGRYLLIAGDEDARVWDLQRRRPLRPPRRQLERITAASWLRGDALVTADDLGRVTVWSIPGVRPLETYEPALQVQALTASPDGRTLIGVAGSNAVLWRSGPQPLALPAFPELAPAPDDLPVALRQVRFAPDGSVLAWQPRGAGVRRFDTSGGQPPIEETTARWSRVSSDGSTVSLGLADRIVVRDAVTRATLLTLPTGAPSVWAEGSSTRDRWLVGYADHVEHLDGAGKLLHRLDVPGAQGTFARRGTGFVIASEAGCTVLDDQSLSRGTFQTETGGRAVAALLSADGTRVACAFGQTGALWSVDRPERPLASLTLPGTVGAPWFVFSADEARLLGPAGAHLAAIWDVRTGNLTAILNGHNEEVLGGAFEVSGRRVATASADGTVRLWDAESGGLLSTHPVGGVAKSVAFGPEGASFAVASETAQLWTLPSATHSAEALRAQVEAGPWCLESGRLLWRASSSPPGEVAGEAAQYSVPKPDPAQQARIAQLEYEREVRQVMKDDEVKAEMMARLARATSVRSRFAAEFGPGSFDTLRVSGLLEPDVLLRTLQPHKAEIVRCASKGTSAPAPVSWTVQPDGTVTGIELQKKSRYARCLETLLSGLRFEQRAGASQVAFEFPAKATLQPESSQTGTQRIVCAPGDPLCGL